MPICPGCEQSVSYARLDSHQRYCPGLRTEESQSRTVERLERRIDRVEQRIERRLQSLERVVEGDAVGSDGGLDRDRTPLRRSR